MYYNEATHNNGVFAGSGARKGENGMGDRTKKALIPGFCLVAAGIVTISFIYWEKLLNQNIGIDAELFFDAPVEGREHFIALGRYGICFLQQTIQLIIKDYPFPTPANTVMACILLLLAGLLICFILNKAASEKGLRMPSVIFLLFFLSSPVWVEQIYFSHQSVECMMAVFLAPAAVLISFYGAEKKKYVYIILSAILVMFITSIYQSALLLFISIFAAAAALSVEYRKSADPLRLSITGGVVTVSGAFTYFFINRMVLYFAKPAERGYLESMIHIGDELYVYRFAAFVYEVLFADVPYLNSKVLDFAGENWGAEYADKLYWNSTISCILFLPVLLIYICLIFKNAAKMKKEGRNAIIYSAFVFWSLMVLISVLFLPVLGGNVEVRALFSLSFAGSYLFYYVLSQVKNKYLYSILLLSVLTVTCVQIKRASKMIETDQLRYEWDCSVAQDVAEKAKKLSGENNVKIKVFGKKEYPPPENSRPGRVIGHSVYSWEESGYRMVAFIRDIGFKDISYGVEDSGMKEILKEMPAYPQEGSLVKYKDTVVVKLDQKP